jgi:hypothetical protein
MADDGKTSGDGKTSPFGSPSGGGGKAGGVNLMKNPSGTHTGGSGNNFMEKPDGGSSKAGGLNLMENPGGSGGGVPEQKKGSYADPRSVPPGGKDPFGGAEPSAKRKEAKSGFSANGGPGGPNRKSYKVK